VIDRRKLIMFLSACAAGVMGTVVESQEKPKATPESGVIFMSDPMPPPTLQLDLSYFGGFVILHKGEEIKIGPDEIWAALGGKL
jgi:hypothetical protein